MATKKANKTGGRTTKKAASKSAVKATGYANKQVTAPEKRMKPAKVTIDDVSYAVCPIIQAEIAGASVDEVLGLISWAQINVLKRALNQRASDLRNGKDRKFGLTNDDRMVALIAQCRACGLDPNDPRAVAEAARTVVAARKAYLANIRFAKAERELAKTG